MKYKLIYILSLLLYCHHCLSQHSFDIASIKQLGLITVEITTVDGEIPTCDYVSAPEGCMGHTCTNQNKVPCKVVIYDNDDVLYSSGEYEKGISGATIKINGNTSSFFENKPYKIKLQNKADLLHRNNDKYEDKNWRLIKDAVTLKTMIGLKVNELLSLPWTPAYKPCNVMLNGEYQGCYLLIESVERNSKCRLNVDKSTGYIVERDAYWWNENKYFATNYFSVAKGYRWTWKYPDEDDVTSEQEQYIQEYINNAEESIKNGTYEDYIDVLSFAKWLLAHDILGTWDSGGSNLYVMKYDNTDNSRLEMANLWDFDTCFAMNKDQFSRYHDGTYDFYFHDLFASSNKSFTNTYKQLWNDKKTALLNELLLFIDNYSHSDEAQALQLSREYHAEKWDTFINNVHNEAIYYKEWLTDHFNEIDSKINAITNIHRIYNKDNSKLYNLLGIKVSSPKKGIYISKGKKYVVN